jgi:ubiquinone/menaquinone biosynthesis C-methylase UbiE
MTSNDSHRPARFDAQAGRFDERAGLSETVCAAIADAIVAIASLRAGQRVLDVGAGTGVITAGLVARGLECSALDESEAMLDVFGARARALGIEPTILVSDAGRRWPVDDASVSLVFGSRSLHWLAADHVCDEAFRVAAPAGCSVLIGRIERAPESPRARLRRAMRHWLRAAGFEGRSGTESTRAIVDGCVERGAVLIATRVAAKWRVHTTPRSILDAWRRKPGLGGADVTQATKADVLARTEAWAVETFGDIDVPTETEECYTLQGAAIAARSPAR